MFYLSIGSKNRSEATQFCSKYGDSVHLPIPRFSEENDFYKTHFSHQRIWLGLYDDDNEGIFKTAKGHVYFKQMKTIVDQTFSESHTLKNHHWININYTRKYEDKGIAMKPNGEWQMVNENRLLDSFCIFNIKPDENCSKCFDEAFCRFTDSKREKTDCVCPKGRTGEFCEIVLDIDCENKEDSKTIALKNGTECLCPVPFFGKNCESSKNYLEGGVNYFIRKGL